MSAVPTSALLVLCNQTLRGRLVESPIVGSVEPIEACAKYAADVETDAMWFADDVGHARNRLDELKSGGVAAVREKLNARVIPGGVDLQKSAYGMKKSLYGYASDVDGIHRRAQKCVSRVETLLASIRSCSTVISDIAAVIHARGVYEWNVGPPAEMPEPTLSSMTAGLDAKQLAVHRQQLHTLYGAQWTGAALEWRGLLASIETQQEAWERLYEERVSAEERLIAGLTDTTVGHLMSVGGPEISQQRLAVSHGIAGELWGQPVGEMPEVRKSHPGLESLIDSSSGEHVWETPPRPEVIAANWNTLSHDERQRLIEEVPWVIGNLPGLPLGVRDAANRRMVEIYQQYPQALAPAQLKLLAEISDILNREHSQIAAYGESRPPIQVGALDLLTAVPKTMVVYGDADSAEHMTVQVPGMNSDAPGALESWDRASLNLVSTQVNVTGRENQGAVIAWLGYDTPDIPLSGDWGVLGSNAAETGAERLALELDGLHVARDGTSAINVLAHSYGTTVATIALTNTIYSVDSLIMLGSAGLDTKHVPSLEVLNVKEIMPGQKAVFTTHADADRLAALGAGVSGRGLPNPQARAPLGLQNFSPVYEGALSFSSEGDAARELEITDGHSTIGEGIKPGLLGSTASRGHGYLDDRTQALDSVAQITTGQISAELLASFLRTTGSSVSLVGYSGGLYLPQRLTEEAQE